MDCAFVCGGVGIAGWRYLYLPFRHVGTLSAEGAARIAIRSGSSYGFESEVSPSARSTRVAAVKALRALREVQFHLMLQRFLARKKNFVAAGAVGRTT
jgi:hypothetical protein